MAKQFSPLQIVLSLTTVCAMAGLALGSVYLVTKDTIKEQKVKIEQQALSDVLGNYKAGEQQIIMLKDSGKIISYWPATKDDQLEAYAIKGSKRGYSSDIGFMVAIDLQDNILGLKILSQSETPGLGTRIEEVASKNYLFGKREKSTKKVIPWFQEQFKGLKAGLLKVNKSKEWQSMTDEEKDALKKANQISALTGATISSKAVMDGINQTILEFHKNLKKEAE